MINDVVFGLINEWNLCRCSSDVDGVSSKDWPVITVAFEQLHLVVVLFVHRDKCQCKFITKQPPLIIEKKAHQSAITNDVYLSFLGPDSLGLFISMSR